MKKRYLICSLGALFYLYDYFIQVTPSVMKPWLMHDFRLNSADFSLLGACFLVPYALMQIPAGLLLDRYGARRLLTVAALLSALALALFSSTASFSLALQLRRQAIPGRSIGDSDVRRFGINLFACAAKTKNGLFPSHPSRAARRPVGPAAALSPARSRRARDGELRAARRAPRRRLRLHGVALLVANEVVYHYNLGIDGRGIEQVPYLSFRFGGALG